MLLWIDRREIQSSCKIDTSNKMHVLPRKENVNHASIGRPLFIAFSLYFCSFLCFIMFL